MSDTVLLIAASDIRPACRDEPDLETRIRKAFAKAQDFWMSTDDDIRFRGALAAVMMETTDEAEKDRIVKSVASLRTLSAMLSHVPVDMEAALKEMESFEPLPLMPLWREAKGEERK